MATAQDLDSILDSYLTGYWKAWPASRATPAGVHTYDSQLEDFSATAIQAEIQRNHSFLTQLDQVDARSLSAGKRIDLAIVRGHIQLTLIDLEQVQAWKHNPQLYVSVLRDAVLDLINSDFAPASRRFGSLAARLKLFPRLVTQARANLELPSELATREAIELADRTADLIEKDVPQVAAEQGAGKKLERDLSKEGARAAAAVRQFSKWMQTDLLPRSKGPIVPGPENYSKAFPYVVGTSLNADEVLADAQRQTKTTSVQMRAAAATLAPGKALPDVLADLSAQHPDAKQFLSAFRDSTLKVARFVLEKRLARLPEHDQLRVQTAPRFYHAAIPFLEAPGPFETDLPTYYYVPDLDDFSPDFDDSLLRQYNNFTIPLDVIRKVYPGTYVQREMMNRTPDLARKVFASRAFLDGWSYYVEQMAFEEGFSSDPGLRLSALADALRCELEAQADILLHTGKISQADAVKLLMDEGFLEKDAAGAEVQRILLQPARASAAFTGKLEILRLRDELKKNQGPAFVLSEFHEHLLELGAPPLSAARQLLMERK